MKALRKALKQNPRTGTLYIQDGEYLSRGVKGDLQFAIELKYGAGWRAAVLTDNPRAIKNAWDNRSKHWQARIVALGEGCKLVIRRSSLDRDTY